MADNANSQYSNPPFGMGNVADTGNPGSTGGDATNSQYANGNLPGQTVESQLSTGLAGTNGPTPPRDGEQALFTDPFAHLSGNGVPQDIGQTSTSKNSLTGLPGFQNVTDTGVGNGSVLSGGSEKVTSDQSSPWRNADGS